MDRTTELPYLISGNNQFGRVNLSRVAARAAVKKAKELLQEAYVDVRISTPRGRILLSDEFDQLEGSERPPDVREASHEHQSLQDRR
jgi:hypothetical protein